MKFAYTRPAIGRKFAGAVFFISLTLALVDAQAEEIPNCLDDAGAKLTKEIWHSNLAIVMAATDPQRGEAVISEFSPAVLFFERLTGIESDTMTFVGRLPTPGISKTIELWQAWYRKNWSEPGFHERVCRVFKNIQLAGENLKEKYWRLPLVREFWVDSTIAWERILRQAEHGRVTIGAKMVDFSAKGEFAFVECAVSVENVDSYYFVEIDRDRPLSVYLGTWESEDGRKFVARYRLYHSGPEVPKELLPGSEHVEIVSSLKDKVEFRQLDFSPELYIPLPDLRMQFVSLVTGIQEEAGFHFRD